MNFNNVMYILYNLIHSYYVTLITTSALSWKSFL